MLKRAIHGWERRLSRRDNNRVVRPFEWGAEFLEPDAHLSSDRDHHKLVFNFNEAAIADSPNFFQWQGVPVSTLRDGWLTFESPVATPFAENNIVHARYFPARPRKTWVNSRKDEVERAQGRAVVVLPHWNAKIHEHVSLCELLSRAGIASLRLSLPYHDRRMLPGFERADYMVSSNIGRTLQANRQAVIDSRAAVHWLRAQGYDRIGIVGTSLGSCVGFLTFIHEEHIKVGVYNHVSSYFGDVVWDGLTTAHVRRGLESVLTREDVRRAFLAISPNSYVKRLKGDRRKALLVSARYDLSFTPELSRLLFNECDLHGVKLDRTIVSCGHYTLGRAPYKYYAGIRLISYLRKHL